MTSRIAARHPEAERAEGSGFFAPSGLRMTVGAGLRMTNGGNK